MCQQFGLSVLLVEPLKGAVRTARVLVGVRTLPVLKVERRLGERVEGVLSLGLIPGDVVLLFVLLNLLLLRSLGSGGSGGLSLLLLLGRGSESERLLDVLSLAEDGLQGGLVNDGLEVADDVGELSAEGSIESDGESALDDGGDGNVSERDAFANEESVGGEVGLEGLERTDLTLGKGGVDLDG